MLTVREVITQAVHDGLDLDGRCLPGECDQMADFILTALKDAGYAFLRPWNDELDGEMTVVGDVGST